MIARCDEYEDLKAQRADLSERIIQLGLKLEHGAKASEIMKELETIRHELYPCLGLLGLYEPEVLRDTLIQLEGLKS
jgi:hypothetical protein